MNSNLEKNITVRKENCWNVRQQEYMLHDKIEVIAGQKFHQVY
jgi:hypothetical protein